ncbi:LysR substrate-binding domain-containing protein [Dongshaea marina]|uniref:LysR substrate-binding domain-containing protein n=1 Tax=Dongshaea marina TaxID=2047966 RepID=UPI000D3E6CE1|nr:LysR substrate-binding domain-containing protein [Dongshaea marina]
MKQFQGLYEFVSVAEKLSFKLAAEALGVSPAQVSRQISTLEQRLGVKLLYRSTRQVALTESGGIYYDYCSKIIEQIDEAESAISQLQQNPMGLLRVTAPHAYGEQVVSPLLNQFVMQYPELKLWLQLSNQVIDLVQEGIDLGIRIGNLTDSSMIARRLTERSLHLVATPDYLAKFTKPNSIRELVNHSCLARFNQAWSLKIDGKEQSYKPKGKLSSDSAQALLNACLEGLGIAQLPNYYLDSYLASGELIPLLEAHQPDPEGIWAIYPHNRQLSPKVKCAVDFLQERIQGTIDK